MIWIKRSFIKCFLTEFSTKLFRKSSIRVFERAVFFNLHSCIIETRICLRSQTKLTVVLSPVSFLVSQTSPPRKSIFLSFGKLSILFMGARFFTVSGVTINWLCTRRETLSFFYAAHYFCLWGEVSWFTFKNVSDGTKVVMKPYDMM